MRLAAERLQLARWHRAAAVPITRKQAVAETAAVVDRYHLKQTTCSLRQQKKNSKELHSLLEPDLQLIMLRVCPAAC